MLFAVGNDVVTTGKFRRFKNFGFSHPETCRRNGVKILLGILNWNDVHDDIRRTTQVSRLPWSTDNFIALGVLYSRSGLDGNLHKGDSFKGISQKESSMMTR
jgi:hypothetical protein